MKEYSGIWDRRPLDSEIDGPDAAFKNGVCVDFLRWLTGDWFSKVSFTDSTDVDGKVCQLDDLFADRLGRDKAHFHTQEENVRLNQ